MRGRKDRFIPSTIFSIFSQLSLNFSQVPEIFISIFLSYLISNFIPVELEYYTISTELICVCAHAYIVDYILSKFFIMSPIKFIYLPSIRLVDYAQEQEMEIDALEAILRDEFKGLWLFFF